MKTRITGPLIEIRVFDDFPQHVGAVQRLAWRTRLPAH